MKLSFTPTSMSIRKPILTGSNSRPWGLLGMEFLLEVSADDIPLDRRACRSLRPADAFSVSTFRHLPIGRHAYLDAASWSVAITLASQPNVCPSDPARWLREQCQRMVLKGPMTSRSRRIQSLVVDDPIEG